MTKLFAMAALIVSLLPSAPALGIRSPEEYQAGIRSGSIRLNGVYRAPTKAGVDPTASLEIFDPAQKNSQLHVPDLFPRRPSQEGLANDGAGRIPG